MRCSSHNGRGGKNGRYKAGHNDRKFDVSKSDHIDSTKTEDNIEFRNFVTSEEYEDLESYERHIYEITFKAGQEAKNKRSLEHGHPERCKDIDQVYEANRTCPEETIKQVGKMNESITAKDLESIMKDYVARSNTIFKGNVMILDYTIHVDEATPHCHLRRVFCGHDKEGLAIPNEAQALKELGIQAPNPDEKIGRYNNAKMAFTEMDRQLFIEVVTEHGFEIESEPIHGRKAKDLATYKLEQINKDILQGEAIIAEHKSLLESINLKIQKMMERVNILNVAEYIFKHEKRLYDAINNELAERNNYYDKENFNADEQRFKTLDFYQEIER